MNESVDKIYNIIKDYRNDEGVFITPADIAAWADQFGPDADFVLDEFAHLLPKIYCSKQDAVKIIRDFMNGQYKDYGFGSIEEYLQKTSFLQLQPQGKSQQVLLGMIDDMVVAKTGRHLADYNDYEKTLFVYLDDVLATGGTIRRDIANWLGTDNHAELLKQKKINRSFGGMLRGTTGSPCSRQGEETQYDGKQAYIRQSQCVDLRQDHWKVWRIVKHVG